MKKSFVLGVLGLAMAAVSSLGSGYIFLDNYISGTAPMITYGYGWPMNGVSGPLAPFGSPLNNAWTVGFYWAPGNTGLNQSFGSGMPDASLTLATGIGSTAQVAGWQVFNEAGYYDAIQAFNSGSTLNTTLTLEIVVYPTVAGSYAAALYRMHSAAFTMPTGAATSPSLPSTGDYMPGVLGIFPVPEPSALALAGLGGLALWLLRRKET